LTEGSSQSVSQSVSQKKIPLNFLKILWQLFDFILDQSERLFGAISFT